MEAFVVLVVVLFAGLLFSRDGAGSSITSDRMRRRGTA